MPENKKNRSQRRNTKNKERQNCANQISEQVIKPLVLRTAANSTILGAHSVWVYLDKEYMSAIRMANSCEERDRAINDLLNKIEEEAFFAKREIEKARREGKDYGKRSDSNAGNKTE